MRRRVVHPRNLRGTGDLYGLAGFVGLLAFLPGAVAVVFGIALSAVSVVLELNQARTILTRRRMHCRDAGAIAGWFAAQAPCQAAVEATGR